MLMIKDAAVEPCANKKRKVCLPLLKKFKCALIFAFMLRLDSKNTSTDRKTEQDYLNAGQETDTGT